MKIKLVNGIYIPINEKEELEKKKLWAFKEFHKRHKNCPQCKLEWNGESTCMGCMYSGDDEVYKYYYDDNYISCYNCGFKGTITDLVE
jgi:hypothetical protein